MVDRGQIAVLIRRAQLVVAVKATPGSIDLLRRSLEVLEAASPELAEQRRRINTAVAGAPLDAVGLVIPEIA